MRRVAVFLSAILGGLLLFWLVKREDDIGEAFCDMDQIDSGSDDPGEDVDEGA